MVRFVSAEKGQVRALVSGPQGGHQAAPLMHRAGFSPRARPPRHALVQSDPVDSTAVPLGTDTSRNGFQARIRHGYVGSPLTVMDRG